MGNNRIILHVDGDEFFASLVRLKNPRLRRRSLIIGNLQSRGNVVAVSHDIRGSGVHPGLTMSQAGRICPDASQVQIDWTLARRASGALMELLKKFTPMVERASMDSAFLDYTGCEALFGAAMDFSRKLQHRIRDDLKLGVSVGLSPDKAVSAVACRAAKLGNLERIYPGGEKSFLKHCPLEWLPGIDSRLNLFFRAVGVSFIGDLARVPSDVLVHILGAQGKIIAARSRGEEGDAVRPDHQSDDP